MWNNTGELKAKFFCYDESVTSCESKAAWRSQIPPSATGRWWSPPASRGTPPSGPGTLGRCRSKIPTSHSPAATQTERGHDTEVRFLSLSLQRSAFTTCVNSQSNVQKSSQEILSVMLPDGFSKSPALGEEGGCSCHRARNMPSCKTNSAKSCVTAQD